MRGWRGQWADRDFHSSPFSGPFGSQVAANAGMEFGYQAFIQRAGLEFLGLHGLFQSRNTLAEEGR